VLAVSAKSPVAVRALAELARSGGDAPVPIAEIGRRRDIPVPVLEGLFASLRRAGIIQSQRGVKGGYLFARPPAEVTVLDVVEALDGDLNVDAREAGQVFADAANAARGVLEAMTIADVAQREAEASMYYI